MTLHPIPSEFSLYMRKISFSFLSVHKEKRPEVRKFLRLYLYSDAECVDSQDDDEPGSV
jgi:hypothetical protein